MKLLTKAIAAKLPALYATDGLPEDQRRVWVKFFDPCGAATWWALEYDPEDRLFFGLADLGVGCPELGYFSLDELEAVRGRFGLGIERDLFWNDNTTLAQVRRGEVR